jgi:uncharacterized membrane protein YhaH (DUF805 family)
MSYAWFYVLDDAQAGPVDESEMLHLIRNGDIKSDTLVWREGLRDWEEARLHFETRRRFAPPNVPRTGTSETGGRRDPAGRGTRPSGGLYAGAPARGFAEAIGVCLRRYFGFSGRASRSEYWYFVLFGVLLGLAAGLLDIFFIDATGTITPLTDITTLLITIPSLAVGFRRLHDTGRSGMWMVLLYLGPIALAVGAALLFETTTGGAGMPLLIGGIAVYLVIVIMVLVFLCTRGDAGPNTYG